MFLQKEVVPFEYLEELFSFLKDVCSAVEQVLHLIEILPDIIKLILFFKFRILEFCEFPERFKERSIVSFGSVLD